MMKERFYLDTIRRLLAEGWLRVDDDVLVVAGGPADRDVLLAAGMRSVVVSNVDERVGAGACAPYGWSFQDAEHLTYPDGSFEVCVVHQALHHCRSPHRALLEMYRVARRGIVAFEPHDSAMTRLGVRLGIGQRYERAAVADNQLHHGGVGNTAVPNFVYRWGDREVRKTLASFDPTGEPRVRSLYDLRVPGPAAHRLRRGAGRVLARVAVPTARALLRAFPGQANTVAIVADKLDPRVDLHPWLVAGSGGVGADAAWFARRGPVPADGDAEGRP
jgi:SAM-dependent methyltransferase